MNPTALVKPNATFWMLLHGLKLTIFLTNYGIDGNEAREETEGKSGRVHRGR